MASSTTPHCSITPSKPYKTCHHLTHHSHRSNPSPGSTTRNGSYNWPPHISLHKPSHTSITSAPNPITSAAASAAAAASSAVPGSSSLNPFSISKSELSVDFCGRSSTRFVSKMRLGRPRFSSMDTRHSQAAEEVLHRAIQLGSGDCRAIDGVLLGFAPRLSRSTDDFTFLLRELGNLGECWKAIRCFEFAVQRVRKGNDQGKLASSMISTLGRLGKADLAKKVFDMALEGGYGRNVYTFSALISAYGRNGYCGEAIKAFESLKTGGLKPNLVTYNAVIDACAKGGVPFAQAGEIFDEMLRNCVQPDRITFNSLLAVCGRSGLWEAARDLFNEMVHKGIEPDMVTYNTLLDALCKGGQMDLAFEVMTEMSSKRISPNVVTYSTLVDGYAKADRLHEALKLFNEMKLAGTSLDRISYNTLLAIYARLGRFEEALNVCREMEVSGIEKDVVTFNALLCGYGKQGKYGEVKKVVEEMKLKQCRPNLLTYSTLMDVYAKGGLHSDAMNVFREFKQAGLEADVVLYSTLIDAQCKNGHVEYAVSLLDQMTREGIKPNVVTYNSIIDAFGRPASAENNTSESSGSASESQVDFLESAESEIGNLEDNRAIDLLHIEKPYIGQKCERSRHEILSILAVFQKMHELDIRPNVVTFSAILTACSRCNSFEDASMLLEELRLLDNQVYGVAHGLLMGHKEHIWAQAQHLFDQVNLMDSSTASAFYNALTDMLWHFGQRRGAQLVVLEGKNRQVWENMWTDSCLDLHLMSSGAAMAIVHSWLLNIRSILFQGHELPRLLSILTGWGKHSKVVGDGALRRAVGSLLVGIGAPFRAAECNIGRFVSTGDVMSAWLKDARTHTVLLLHDDRTYSDFGRTHLIPNFLALPL